MWDELSSEELSGRSPILLKYYVTYLPTRYSLIFYAINNYLNLSVRI